MRKLRDGPSWGGEDGDGEEDRFASTGVVYGILNRPGVSPWAETATVLIFRTEVQLIEGTESTMAGITSVDLARAAGEHLESASPDLVRAMLQTFAEALMGAEADAACGAPYGEVSAERVNCRNGYRGRRWDTRAGTEPVAFSRVPSAETGVLRCRRRPCGRWGGRCLRVR
jgi:hypothetical protein